MRRWFVKLPLLLVALGLSVAAGCALAPTPTAPRPTVAQVPATVASTPIPAPTLTSTPSPSPAPSRPIGALLAMTATTMPSPANRATRVPASPRAPAATRTPSLREQPQMPVGGHIQWEARALLVGPGQPGRLYVLLANRGTDFFPSEQMRFLISDDFGATWSPFAGGLPVEPGCVNNINLDDAAPDALYASTCQGLFAWREGVWTRISPQITRQVAIVYGQPNNIWGIAATAQDPAIISSRDGGATWRPASDGLDYAWGMANLAIDPRDAQTLYAIRTPKWAGSYLRRAFANNQWQIMPTPHDDSQIDIGMTLDGATGAVYVSAYVDQHWQLWRTLNPTASNVKAVDWEMVHDFADNWTTVLASGWSPQGLALYVRVSPPNGDSVVERSLDGGKTWQVVAIQWISGFP